MKKLRVVRSDYLTLEEGCNKYLDNCLARNLRKGNMIKERQPKIVALNVKEIHAIVAWFSVG
ncbi:MAG: hypothetical protein E7676_06840 [Ruminococcaceae bacterium]|nr:hypothetical protein [Oscillospiraceae bacterium]